MRKAIVNDKAPRPRGPYSPAMIGTSAIGVDCIAVIPGT